jgi:6-phosphogluconolactonase
MYQGRPVWVLATRSLAVNDRRSVLVAASPSEALALAAKVVADVARESVGHKGQFALALAGGTTPQPLYKLLAVPNQADAVPWQETHVFFGDERDVPADHADSNFRMVQDSLLDHVPVRLENVHPMHGDAADLDLAARRYAERIAELVPAGSSGRPAFDLILLGMGGDGHTASLFPDTPALDEHDRLVVSQFIPVLGRRRLTFTFPLINAARNVLFLVTGMDKAEAVSQVLSDEPDVASQLPAGRVVPADGKLILVLDSQAARQVSGRFPPATP